MVLHILRALFVLLMAAVGWSFVTDPNQAFYGYNWTTLAIALTTGTLIVCVDLLAPRRKLAIFSGTFVGLLVGVAMAYALSFVTPLLVDQALSLLHKEIPQATVQSVVRFLNLMLGVMSCYLSISFILQTKDDFRFVIPYVEFSRQTKGARAMLLDTSVLIDGRIGDIAATGIIESQFIVPRFIQAELQQVADSADKLTRARGRRGLDILTRLKNAGRPEVIDYDSSGRDDPHLDVDQKLIALAKEINARVLTNDFNLIKVAQLRGIDVVNVNDLATAVKPAVLPGEAMHVRLIKTGEGPSQGVGYLEDGTMVVVEQGRGHVNQDVRFIVTNVRQTQMGKMIFGRLAADDDSDDRDDYRDEDPSPRASPPRPPMRRSPPGPNRGPSSAAPKLG